MAAVTITDRITPAARQYYWISTLVECVQNTLMNTVLYNYKITIFASRRELIWGVSDVILSTVVAIAML